MTDIIIRVVICMIKGHGNIKELLTICFGVVLYYFILNILGISCPIKEITGISCPGCGMTRALMHAIVFWFDKAFYYHPLWIIMPFALVILLILYFKDEKKAINIVLTVLVALFIIVFLYRLIWGDGRVVSFEPQEGLLFKLVNSIKTFIFGS